MRTKGTALSGKVCAQEGQLGQRRATREGASLLLSLLQHCLLLLLLTTATQLPLLCSLVNVGSVMIDWSC
jgi:hypothetical protein